MFQVTVGLGAELAMLSDYQRVITLEIGMLGAKGFSVNDPSKKYQLRSLPGDFTGLHLLCLEYAGFKIINPAVDIGFDISAEYTEARWVHGGAQQPEETMSWIMVDIEADGLIPGDYSMVSFGAVVVEPGLERTFYGDLRPISDDCVPEALAVSGFTREQTLAFPQSEEVMLRFAAWVTEVSAGRPVFISDNNGFDWQFINWYFHHFIGANPFGFSSTNLGSLHKGLVRDTTKNFKHLRKTRHTHHPVDDAKGNAEALLAMRDGMELKIRLS